MASGAHESYHFSGKISQERKLKPILSCISIYSGSLKSWHLLNFVSFYILNQAPDVIRMLTMCLISTSVGTYNIVCRSAMICLIPFAPCHAN